MRHPRRQNVTTSMFGLKTVTYTKISPKTVNNRDIAGNSEEEEEEEQQQQDLILFVCVRVPQLYLWGSPLLGEIFAYVTVFFNPTIKVITCHLHGWCVLGVFLLPAFTHLGHERQDLLSPCDEMHVCTD